ncbi:LemA family protein [Schleiferiaceae bacterium]|jgi:LemA protein|nr:LemA family protein [Schleiferiaceae bacterium]MDA9151126.1 LemA family protein [Schleiferiaceae bacterium]
MKRSTITIFSIVAAVLMLILWGVNTNNRFVSLNEDITGQWAQVESAYQRRADLIPNLVATVKGYADFEQETLTQVIEARAKATSVNLDANNLSQENIAAFQAAQGAVKGSLDRLLLTVERYPDLKANQNFLALQNQLEGTENRINVARDRFNKSTQAYNSAIKRIPASWIAGMGGFEARGYFEAEAGAESAPEVSFE